MKNEEYVYVVLVRALTRLGKIGRKINGYEYTHAAVSLDSRLDDFVTFSRKKHSTPFDAGFMHEKREHYAFGSHKRVKVKAFRIPVSKERMQIITDYVQAIEQDEEYIFNLYSMLTMPLLHGFKIYKAHNCMSFVSKIVELSGRVEMKRDFVKYDIPQIDRLLEKFFLKEGYLVKKQEDGEYMSREGLLFQLKTFLKLNAKLIYRMIWKRKEYDE